MCTIKLFLTQCFQIAIWIQFLKCLKKITFLTVTYISRDKKWMHNVMDVTRKTFRKHLHTELSDTDAFNEWIDNWYAGLHHLIGACLCIPYIFYMRNTYHLVQHSALSEVSWEIKHIIDMIQKPNKISKKLTLLFALHHSLSLILVLPLNVYLDENHDYAVAIGTLQFSGALYIIVHQINSTSNNTKILAYGAVIQILSILIFRFYFYLTTLTRICFLLDPSHLRNLIWVVAFLIFPCFNIILLRDSVNRFLKWSSRSSS